MKRFIAVLKARTLEFLRDRSALGWNLIMPIAFVFSFAFLFSGENKEVYHVAVYPESAPISSHELSFFETRYIKFFHVKNLQAAIEQVEHHQLDMVIDLSTPSRYWVNSTSANGYFLEKLLVANSINSENIASLSKETAYPLSYP